MQNVRQHAYFIATVSLGHHRPILGLHTVETVDNFV